MSCPFMVASIPGDFCARRCHRPNTLDLACRQSEARGLIEQRIDSWIAAACAHERQYRQCRYTLSGCQCVVFDELSSSACSLVPLAATECEVGAIRTAV